MFIKITDASLQAVWVNPANISAIIMPSPLSPGAGKNMVMVAPAIGIEVTSSEASRVLTVLNTPLEVPSWQ